MKKARINLAIYRTIFQFFLDNFFLQQIFHNLLQSNYNEKQNIKAVMVNVNFISKKKTQNLVN